MAAIEIQNLSKTFRVHKRPPGLGAAMRSFFQRTYDSVEAVKNIAFEIAEGEVVGFLGPNGAGKTTTLKMVSGLLYPSAGTVKTLGVIPQKRAKGFLAQIALVMGNRSQLWWEIPIEESFKLNCAIYELEDTFYKKSIGELVELLEIKELLRIPSKKLSLGQRMKAELAVALLHRPKLLLLDEPTLGLDVVMQKKIRQFLTAYNQRNKATILLTSHNMEDVSELCPRILMIDKGRLIYDGSLKSLIERYAPNKRISLYFAGPAAPSALEKFGLVHLNGDGLSCHMEVPRRQVSQTAAALLNNSSSQLPPILDLSIEEPPIEDVIRLIFKEGLD